MKNKITEMEDRSVENIQTETHTHTQIKNRKEHKTHVRHRKTSLKLCN